MKISSFLEKSEIKNLQQKFYEYFESGYNFEEFLKEYLLKMGLDEVEITQRSRDGGVDLKAIRKGVGDFSEIDIVHYYIQAKRYSLENKISVKTIRELKGTIPFGYKGMLITTSDFTDDATSEAINDPSKPVVIINGNSLVMSCIDNGIGFIFKPYFNAEQMDIFLGKKEKENVVNIQEKQVKSKLDYIEKNITINDIRARIISVPSSIISVLNEEKVNVVVNDTEEYTFTINKRRNYFAGVTSFLKKYKLLSSDGIINPKKVKWSYDVKREVVKIYLED